MRKTVSSMLFLATLWGGAAYAQNGDVVCRFEGEVAAGDIAALGSLHVAGVLPYETDYTIEVGVWVDDAFVADVPDPAAFAVRYFEHANCVFAAGRNLSLGNGNNRISLKIAGDRVRYYDNTTPNAPGVMWPWAQQLHWEWFQDMQAMPGQPPKVNILFTTGGIAETGAPPNDTTWGGVGGAANGFGQGNAIIQVDPTWYANGMSWNGLVRTHAEDWWGVITAHELGHALGKNGHVDQYYDTMCCGSTPYTNGITGRTASQHFALSEATWSDIWQNHVDTDDKCADPYRFGAGTNPVTGEYWSYFQISSFLVDRDGGDVFVAASNGWSFLDRDLRHDWFCINDEVCLTGDFDGDGKDDLIAFTRGVSGDVFVSLSTGTGFDGTGVKWHDFFAINAETPLVGDVNGDGRDDIISFTGGAAADVYVALSTGWSFSGTGAKWHDGFNFGTEVPQVGDFNGDGKADIASFSRGTTGDVHVALSNGAAFGARVKWHDFFCINDELPRVGDFNGDGRDDIATFTRGSTGDVYVALSYRGTFSGTGQKWHDYFAINNELPFVGDVTGDGKDDIVSFQRGSLGRVYVASSFGSGFNGTAWLWTDNICLGTDVCALGDVTGGGKADAIGFHRY